MYRTHCVIAVYSAWRRLQSAMSVTAVAKRRQTLLQQQLHERGNDIS